MQEQKLRNQPRRTWIWVAGAVIVVVIAFFYWRHTRNADGASSPQGSGEDGKGKGGNSKANARNQQVPVVVVPAKSGDIGVYLNGLGSVTPLNTVTVKTRIDGQLMQVLFKEGQIVRQGDLLAMIDPRTYEAALLQAQGQMARDEALLKNARIDLDRYRTLFKQDSIAEQQVATQESLVKQDEGIVKIDQAAIDTAKVNLIYTKITAPVSGRLGLRQVDPGNIVHAADTNGLVVITQLQPISVLYTIPEDSVPGVMKRLQAGEKLLVDAWDRAEKARLASGTLLSMDNQIDQTTGTVKLRATFPNTDYALFPMQFVNTHMLVETEHNAVIIPAAAVQRGTPGTFVYVIKPDGTATVRPIKLGPTLADRAAVDSGVAVGENVVVDGGDKLREGAKVEIATHCAAPTVVAAKGAGNHKKKGDSSAPPPAATPATGAPGAAPASGAAAPCPPSTADATSADTPAGTGAIPTPDSKMEGSKDLTPEQKQARWAKINARIDAGDFGEDMKKLPEDQRKKKMQELRKQKNANADSQNPQ